MISAVVPRLSEVRPAWRAAGRVLMVGLSALTLAGCLSRGGSADVTGSIGGRQAAPTSEEGWRAAADSWGKRYEANPADKQAALAYAQALRALDQRAQAVAVLQTVAIRAPKDTEILAAYGKALIDVGRFKEAAEVLARAHTPDRPDWRILSAQGIVADQLGEPETARRYYEAALKIAPGEPSVMSNLGLSYALAKRLPEAERTLRQAAEDPRADARVRQNLALVLGLQGKFGDAETVLRRDLPPAEAAANAAYLKQVVSQPNSWNAIRSLDGQGKAAPRRTAQSDTGLRVATSD
ncbi:tetratricopeptide repeat protein [Chelatococcus sp. SYSU_G07232]|uniref:Tetratricopeptide repeat protein n=1 Tax=Chelatococcus albus TaxID=3047466 RepID=A0ABT7AF32_9HYPH|nr:tetratricopeptide repeat protein [Chelatococcus sp. SYSU_G07232]MDJ1157612.1 tetratricopeptide repeat protein [Chelatococcus sp. SYSU_G07232]